MPSHVSSKSNYLTTLMITMALGNSFASKKLKQPWCHHQWRYMRWHVGGQSHCHQAATENSTNGSLPLLGKILQYAHYLPTSTFCGVLHCVGSWPLLTCTTIGGPRALCLTPIRCVCPSIPTQRTPDESKSLAVTTPECTRSI